MEDMKQIRTLKDFLWTALLSTLTILPLASYAAAVTQQDKELANKLAQGSVSEVQIGKIVKDKANDPAVKDFANRMIEDHSKMDQQIRHWASLNSIKLPTTPSADSQELKGRLAKASGKSYDQEYIRSMLEDHKKDVAELQNFMASHPDSSLKSVVTQTLPILENHLRVAENVAGKLGVDAKPGLNKPEHPQS
jgi:putative membrane protein